MIKEHAFALLNSIDKYDNKLIAKECLDTCNIHKRKLIKTISSKLSIPESEVTDIINSSTILRK